MNHRLTPLLLTALVWGVVSCEAPRTEHVEPEERILWSWGASTSLELDEFPRSEIDTFRSPFRSTAPYNFLARTGYYLALSRGHQVVRTDERGALLSIVDTPWPPEAVPSALFTWEGIVHVAITSDVYFGPGRAYPVIWQLSDTGFAKVFDDEGLGTVTQVAYRDTGEVFLSSLDRDSEVRTYHRRDLLTGDLDEVTRFTFEDAFRLSPWDDAPKAAKALLGRVPGAILLEVRDGAVVRRFERPGEEDYRVWIGFAGSGERFMVFSGRDIFVASEGRTRVVDPGLPERTALVDGHFVADGVVLSWEERSFPLVGAAGTLFIPLGF